MAARCLGLSIFLLWCFWAALDALMRVWELLKDECTCLLVSCSCRGSLRLFVGLGSPTVLVCVTALASLYNAKGRAVARYACIHQP